MAVRGRGWFGLVIAASGEHAFARIALRSCLKHERIANVVHKRECSPAANPTPDISSLLLLCGNSNPCSSDHVSVPTNRVS